MTTLINSLLVLRNTETPIKHPLKDHNIWLPSTDSYI